MGDRPIGISWVARQPMGYPWPTPKEPPIGYPWASNGLQNNTHAMLMGCPWDTHSVPTGYPCGGLLMGSLSGVQGPPLGYPSRLFMSEQWAAHGLSRNPIGCPWGSHGITMRCLRDSYESLVYRGYRV